MVFAIFRVSETSLQIVPICGKNYFPFTDFLRSRSRQLVSTS